MTAKKYLKMYLGYYLGNKVMVDKQGKATWEITSGIQHCCHNYWQSLAGPTLDPLCIQQLDAAPFVKIIQSFILM